jgi:hypothetical protein
VDSLLRGTWHLVFRLVVKSSAERICAHTVFESLIFNSATFRQCKLYSSSSISNVLKVRCAGVIRPQYSTTARLVTGLAH